jgi:D-lactate dehydrogenase
MQISFFDIEGWEQEYVSKKFSGHELLFFKDPLTIKNAALAKDSEAVSIFGVDIKISKDVLDSLAKTKLLTTRSTGFDHIDLEEAKKLGMTVCNVPTYGENTVAEHAFALILDLSRNISKSIKSVKENGFSAKGLMGFDLRGKTLGIVGLGHIGLHVAEIARGFEMNVLAFDVRHDDALAEKLGFTYAELNDVLAQSDIITLHVPYNQHTHHLINQGNVEMIKKGAYLINTARGAVIETAALVAALDKEILAGAALDVLEGEFDMKEERELPGEEMLKTADMKTLEENHILLERDNVIITPHNAFNSKEAIIRILDTTAENIIAFQNGKPVNVVG